MPNSSIKQSEPLSEVHINGQAEPTMFRIFESTPNFLEYHGLDSYYFAEIEGYLEQADLERILLGLISGQDRQEIEGKIYYVNVFSDAEYRPITRLEKSVIYGICISSYSRSGLNHYFFKRAGANYGRVKKLDNKTIRLYDNRETTLLHYASFPSSPKSSGIFLFRTKLNPEEISHANSWTEDSINTLLIDEIYSDPELQIGVAFLDNSPDAGQSCGGRCRDPAPTRSVCRVDVSGTNFGCEPLGNDGSCFGHNATEVAMMSKVDFSLDLVKIRRLENEVLVISDIGREYLSYRPALDRNLKSDVKSLMKYLQIFPKLYTAVNILLSRDAYDSDVVISDEVYTIGRDLLNEYKNVEDPNFRALCATVRSDLEATRGLGKSDFLKWLQEAQSAPRILPE